MTKSKLFRLKRKPFKHTNGPALRFGRVSVREDLTNLSANITNLNRSKAVSQGLVFVFWFGLLVTYSGDFRPATVCLFGHCLCIVCSRSNGPPPRSFPLLKIHVTKNQNVKPFCQWSCETCSKITDPSFRVFKILRPNRSR